MKAQAYPKVQQAFMTQHIAFMAPQMIQEFVGGAIMNLK